MPTVEERPLENANGGERSSHLRTSCQYRERRMAPAICFGLLLMLAFQVPWLTIPADAASVSQEQSQNAKRQPLGSLTATGEVHVNDKLAPAESMGLSAIRFAQAKRAPRYSR